MRLGEIKMTQLMKSATKMWPAAPGSAGGYYVHAPKSFVFRNPRQSRGLFVGSSTRLLLSILFSFFILGAIATAENKTALAWPQFRGPNGSAIAEHEKPPVEFGPTMNVKWSIACPSGLSSPIVVGDKLVLTAFDDNQLSTVAFDRATGNQAWAVEAPAKKIEQYYKGQGSPASSTCATDGNRIVSYFGSCGLFCYDLKGHEIWRFEMPPAQTVAGFGTGNSPIIANGAVILDREELKDPKIISIDLVTGQPNWETKRQSISSFATPSIWDTPSGKQIVTPGFKKMVGYDLKSGKEIWHVDGMPAAACTSPVTLDGNLLYAGWSPGDPNDKDFQMPDFDSILKAGDTNHDGVLSKEESAKTPLKDFFDIQDANKDGKLTRQEYETIQKFSAESRNSAFALKPGGTGDVTTSHVVWKNTKGLPYVSSAIAYRGQYLMVKDGGIVTAYDTKDGKELYRKRAVASGTYYASPVAANGNIYFISLDNGEVTVLEGGSPSPKTIAKNPPLGERTAATPAIADDTIYIRTEGHLYAFAQKK
jgi:outer membrane protein assembly factor BamB